MPEGWDALAAELGLELIAPARPGYGRSEHVEMANVAAWPDLVVPVLDQLDVTGPFRIAASSAGAPYGCALAAALGGRVERFAVRSGVPHVADPAVLERYGPTARDSYGGFRDTPLEELAEHMSAGLGELVESVAGDGAQRWGDDLRASLAQGGLGPAREAMLQIRPWGFDLAEVRTPVRWWHARDDQEVPFAAAELTVEALASARLVALDHGGHLLTPQIHDEMLRWLAAEGAA